MRVKNNKQTSDVWAGQTIEPAAEYDIQPNELSIWRSNDKVIQDLSTGDLSIGNGVTYKSTSAEAVAYLLGASNDVTVISQPPFSAKTVGGLKIYTRASGKIHTVIVGSNNLDFSITYDNMKFNGVEITNAKAGERVSLQVLDTPTGTISTVPNYMLNQFGFDLNLPDGFYVRESSYDADLIKDLKIRIIYEAIEARDIYVNYLIHEVKP